MKNLTESHCFNYFRSLWICAFALLISGFIFGFERLYFGLPRPFYLYFISTLLMFILLLGSLNIPAHSSNLNLLSVRFKMRMLSIALFFISPFCAWTLLMPNDFFFSIGTLIFVICFVAYLRELAFLTLALTLYHSPLYWLICLLKTFYFMLLIVLVVIFFKSLFSTDFLIQFVYLLPDWFYFALLVFPILSAFFVLTRPYSAYATLVNLKNNEVLHE